MLSFDGLYCCNQLSSTASLRNLRKLRGLADIKLFVQTILDSIIIIADMCFYFWNCLWCPKCSSKKTFHRMPKLICFNSIKGIIQLHYGKIPFREGFTKIRFPVLTFMGTKPEQILLISDRYISGKTYQSTDQSIFQLIMIYSQEKS